MLATDETKTSAARPRGAAEESAAAPAKKARDGRLDFWRGLCLIDMVLVHMLYEGVRMGAWLTPVVGEYLRFAAGGFIFLAGLGVAYIYLQKARDNSKRSQTYRSLWTRSLYLLGVHYAASLSFIMIYPLRGFHGPYPSPWQYLTDVLLLRQGSDLLLFYVMMVGLAPFMLELMRRGQAWLLAVFSVGLFAVGHWHPRLLALPIQQGFLPVLWQMIFVAGLLAGAGLKKYDALTPRGKVLATAAAWGATALVWLMAYGPLALWAWNAGIGFAKSPLSAGEAVRYLTLILAIMLSTDLIWRWIRNGAAIEFVSRLGRRSLAVYVAHIWVVALMVALAQRMEWAGSMQIVLVGIAVMLLYAWTRVMDAAEQGVPSKKDEDAPLVRPVVWRLSGAATAAVGVAFMVNAVTQNRHGDDGRNLLLSHVAPPANLAGAVDPAEDEGFGEDEITPQVPDEGVPPEMEV